MSRIILFAGRAFALGVVLLLPALYYQGVTPEDAEKWAHKQGEEIARAWIPAR